MARIVITGIPNNFKRGGWLTDVAASIKQKGTEGFCTPMSKPTCTGRRRQFALMMKKKHGFQKKQMGGAAPQGSTIDNAVAGKKNYFNDYVRNNAMDVWDMEEAMNLSSIANPMMAQMGMETDPGLNYQNMDRLGMYQDQMDQYNNQMQQDMFGLYGATQDLLQSQNPYYEAQMMQVGGQPYSYGAAPYLIPMNQYPSYKFRTNYAPGPGSYFPQGFDPNQAKNFKFDYKSRFFGPGPRRVKMSWDELTPGAQNVQGSAAAIPVNPMLSPTQPSYSTSFTDAEKMDIMRGKVNPNYSTEYTPEELYDIERSKQQFKQGGVYELNQDQIQAIMKAGGIVEYID